MTGPPAISVSRSDFVRGKSGLIGAGVWASNGIAPANSAKRFFIPKVRLR